MTKLTPEQTNLLAQIGEAKSAYDKWDAQASLELSAARNLQKEPIRRLVASAIERGVPVRQIHLNGLGLKQVGQMTSFLDGLSRNNREGLTAILTGQVAGLEAAVPTAGGAKKIVQQNTNTALIDRDGKETKISRMDIGQGVYWLDDDEVDYLTDVELELFRADHAKTLFGKEQFDNYALGIEPAHWA